MTRSPPGTPVRAWVDAGARDEVVTKLVNDAGSCSLLLREPTWIDDQERLVGLLALVAGQDVEQGDQPGSRRIGRDVAKERAKSTVDPEARHIQVIASDEGWLTVQSC